MAMRWRLSTLLIGGGVAVAAGLLSLRVGAGTLFEDDAALERPAPAAPPITRVDLGERHFVEFRELGPGRVAMYEQGSLEDGDKPSDTSDWGHLTLSDIHRRLRPDEAVPKALERAQRRRSQQAAQYATVQSPPSAADVADGRGAWGFYKAPPGPPPQLKGTAAKSAAAEGSPLSPSDDLWFTESFCGGLQAHSVWCPLNWGSAHSGWRPTMYYEADGMVVSSIAGGTFWVEQWNGSQWVRVVTVNGGPRTWWRWIIWGEGWFRSGMDGQSPQPWIHFAERTRFAITGFADEGFHPFEAEWQFNNDIQGVTTGADHWFFTRTVNYWDGSQEGMITAAPVWANLNYEPGPQYTAPAHWTAMGYDHYGDLTRRGDLLYVAIEDETHSRCAIGVLRTDIRYYVGLVPLPGVVRCAWIAYNPKDDLFYTTEWGVNLRRFAITVNDLRATERLPAVTLSTTISNIQGAEFSSLGNLYVFKGWHESYMLLYGIDPYNGLAYYRTHYYGSGDADQWEAEGLTVWDLTDGRSPYARGHLHLQILDNDTDNDDFSFAHLRALEPWRL